MKVPSTKTIFALTLGLFLTTLSTATPLRGPTYSESSRMIRRGNNPSSRRIVNRSMDPTKVEDQEFKADELAPLIAILPKDLDIGNILIQKDTELTLKLDKIINETVDEIIDEMLKNLL